jgi:hypothetical protein
MGLDVLERLEQLNKQRNEEMDKVSERIKKVEGFLKTLTLDETISFLIQEGGTSVYLSWNYGSKRLEISDNGFSKPLIECKFKIRQLVVMGNYLETLLSKIAFHMEN